MQAYTPDWAECSITKAYLDQRHHHSNDASLCLDCGQELKEGEFDRCENCWQLEMGER